MNISVLMTVYNEQDFLEYAIQSCLPYINNLIIVEGAYQETINIGGAPRSTDKTNEIIFNLFSVTPCSQFSLSMPDGTNVEYIQANEQTDKDQRNVGLEIAKKLDTDWLWIIDGDEVYKPNMILRVEKLCEHFDKIGVLGCYFKSLTFVNDLEHYCIQEFPRIFRITDDECTFVNDNFMKWSDKLAWEWPTVTKMPQIEYFHYGFCKNENRFLLKKKWWETRFGRPFDYGWRVENNKIVDDNHKIMKFTGKHPDIIRKHFLLDKK